jgi:hypothetical protein
VENEMRMKIARLLAALVMMLAALPTGALAQRTSVQATAVNTYNAAGTMRLSGALDVTPDRVISGDVAVLNGPVTVAGRIDGTLVAINADVRLVTGASITGNLIVVGGTVTREDGVNVGGEVRTQAELLFYTIEDDRLVPEGRGTDWRPRFGRTEYEDRGDSYTDLFFLAARSYNRVEGLSAVIGPRIRRPTTWGRVEVEAFGVVRSAEPIRWDRGTLGHDIRADLRLGVTNGLTLGARAFDVIDPVEDWQLRDTEAGLAAFVLHRDMRDWYGRHGFEASLGGRLGEEMSLSVAGGSERWRSPMSRAPFTLFRDGDPWRQNPGLDVGKVDLTTIRLAVDTRDRLRSPWLGGWYIRADLERGRGSITRDPGPLPVVPFPEDVNYTRGFVDARRYTRISHGTAVNARVVAGGWLGGDQLPLQRRLSVGGPGSVEGHDFRRAFYDTDVFTCGGMAERAGRPTLCDRIALAQLELRQEFDIDVFRNDHRDDWWRPGLNTRPAWVIFADAGRGWGVQQGSAGIQHERGLPPLSSFRTSIGAGLDFGSLGVYLAKSTSTGREPLNVIVRLGRRF